MWVLYLQWLQANFGSKWNTVCRFKSCFVLKYLPSGQTEHLNDLTSLWVAWCLTNDVFWENFLSQTWQTKGFSPVWVL